MNYLFQNIENFMVMLPIEKNKEIACLQALELKHILVEHEYEVQDLLKKIEEGVSFEDSARDFSKMPIRCRGR